MKKALNLHRNDMSLLLDMGVNVFSNIKNATTETKFKSCSYSEANKAKFLEFSKLSKDE